MSFSILDSPFAMLALGLGLVAAMHPFAARAQTPQLIPLCGYSVSFYICHGQDLCYNDNPGTECTDSDDCADTQCSITDPHVQAEGGARAGLDFHARAVQGGLLVVAVGEAGRAAGLRVGDLIERVSGLAPQQIAFDPEVWDRPEPRRLLAQRGQRQVVANLRMPRPRSPRAGEAAAVERTAPAERRRQ